jgi:hypothetical protein
MRSEHAYSGAFCVSGYRSVIKIRQLFELRDVCRAKNFKAFTVRCVAFPSTFDATIAVRHQSRKANFRMRFEQLHKGQPPADGAPNLKTQAQRSTRPCDIICSAVPSTGVVPSASSDSQACTTAKPPNVQRRLCPPNFRSKATQINPA